MAPRSSTYSVHARRQQYLICTLALMIGLFGLTGALLGDQGAAYAQGSSSLRFYGTGSGDLDRVKIALGPLSGGQITASRPVNVGNDFTIEFWIKATAAENSAPACDGNGWYYGNIIVDRDVDGAGDYGDYGIAICNQRLVFGVNAGGDDRLLVSPVVVTDGQWHHVAATRDDSGAMALFVDGQPAGSRSGPVGRIDYRLNRATSQPNSDPYLVLGAEKHDYPGSRYYSGWLDDLRISNAVRYTSAFVRPTAPHGLDTSTIALYRFDEGSGTGIGDSGGAAGGPSGGELKPRSGGAGQHWSSDTPFGGAPAPTTTVQATATALPTATFQPTATATRAPTSAPTATAQPTATVQPTATATRAPTSAPTAAPTSGAQTSASNRGLGFGGDDLARLGAALPNLTADHTVELWVNPATANQTSVLVATTDEASGWALELSGGRLILWVYTTTNEWRSVSHSTALATNTWSHVAFTYSAGGRSARLFVNGAPSQIVTVGSLTAGPLFSVGGLTPHAFFRGQIDELRVSSRVRYASSFTRPSRAFATDSATVALYSLNDGSGQTAADRSGNGYTLTLGTRADADSADPAWVNSGAPTNP